MTRARGSWTDDTMESEQKGKGGKRKAEGGRWRWEQHGVC
jgi:hypothetical protein